MGLSLSSSVTNRSRGSLTGDKALHCRFGGWGLGYRGQGICERCSSLADSRGCIPRCVKSLWSSYRGLYPQRLLPKFPAPEILLLSKGGPIIVPLMARVRQNGESSMINPVISNQGGGVRGSDLGLRGEESLGEGTSCTHSSGVWGLKFRVWGLGLSEGSAFGIGGCWVCCGGFRGRRDLGAQRARNLLSLYRRLDALPNPQPFFSMTRDTCPTPTPTTLSRTPAPCHSMQATCVS
jgi:hypothetical protein